MLRVWDFGFGVLGPFKRSIKKTDFGLGFEGRESQECSMKDGKLDNELCAGIRVMGFPKVRGTITGIP